MTKLDLLTERQWKPEGLDVGKQMRKEGRNPNWLYSVDLKGGGEPVGAIQCLVPLGRKGEHLSLSHVR